ncbi:hypothetical protein, partial [Enterococcus faecalis]|uniref:hypothetical protein n=1 Tax=Enterococcus faecalis TaxID=1351 RepID=UPI003D6A53FA
GKIYYSDTDSIVVDKKLPESIVSSNELGKLKLEHEIIEGYFISDKTFPLVDINGKVINKCKGIDSKHLSLEDYKRMYNMESITNATKT